MSNKTTWTSEQRAEAVRRWGAGEPARALILEYGVTRNALMGAAHRAGVSSPLGRTAPRPRGKARTVWAKPAAPAKRRARSVARRQAPKRVPQKTQIAPAAKAVNGGIGVELLDLEAGQCRWPVSDGGAGGLDEMRFCGQKIFKDERQKLPAWCLAHQHLGLTRPQRLVAKQSARLECAGQTQNKEDVSSVG